MFGFVFGAACLVGLAFTLKRGPHHHAHHPRCGHHHRGHGGRGDRMMRYAFAELGTSVAQEKVLREAMERVRVTARTEREAMAEGRAHLAAWLRSPTLNAESMQDARAKVEQAAARMATSMQEAFATAHETLSPEQRALLAERLERAGHRGWGRGGCHHGRSC